jgi:hypothetical protein
MAPDVKIVIFGSGSALCTHPDLDEVSDTYSNTLDVDFVFEPWDNLTGQMLEDALGRESLFFDRYKYFGDFIRPAVFANFPPDFRDRLVPLEGCPNVWALDPHDMAVAKLWAGREKDLKLLSILLATDRLDEAKVRRLLWSVEMEEKWIVKTQRFLEEVVAAARALGYARPDLKETWRNS